ncbi:MAG TPA: hypothetical protein VFV37_06745 [Luteibaculaceae bacterium]|nr:hypothetical protein [Luteibaculaceae bacterium]
MSRKLLVFAALLVASQLVLAQEVPMADVLPERKPKNYIKTNLFGLPFRNFSLSYERAQFKFLSFGLDFRLMPSGGVPATKFIQNQFGDDDSGILDGLSAVDLSGRAITPFVRLYPTKKGYGRGFYFQVQYRNVNYSADNLQFKYTNNANEEQSIALSGDFSSNTVGLGIGKQWTFAKYFFIDWVMTGFQFGSAKGEFVGEYTERLSPEDQKTVEDALNTIDFTVPVINKPIEVEADAGDNRTTLKIKSPWFMPMVGLSFGVRF